MKSSGHKDLSHWKNSTKRFEKWQSLHFLKLSGGTVTKKFFFFLDFVHENCIKKFGCFLLPPYSAAKKLHTHYTLYYSSASLFTSHNRSTVTSGVRHNSYHQHFYFIPNMRIFYLKWASTILIHTEIKNQEP